MINKNDIEINDALFDHDIIRKNIRKSCEKISLYSPKILRAIIQEGGVVFWKKLVENHPKAVQFPALMHSIRGLQYIIEGKIFLPDKDLAVTMQSIATSIFMEEAQVILQNRVNQEYAIVDLSYNSSNLQQSQQAVPSLEQSQQCAFVDETRDSDGNLFNNSDNDSSDL